MRHFTVNEIFILLTISCSVFCDYCIDGHQDEVLLEGDDYQSPQLNCTNFDCDLEERRKKLEKLMEEEEDTLKNDGDLEDLSAFSFLLDHAGKDLKRKSNSVIAGELTEDQKSQIKCVFNPLDKEEAIVNANKRPELVADMTSCQINHIFQWCEVLRSLNSTTFRHFFEDTKLVKRLRNIIPDTTLAESMKCGVSFFKYVKMGSSAQEYVKILVVQRDFLRRLSRDMVAQIMNAENSLELDDEMILKALDTYPDLPLLLQDSGLERAAKQFSDQNLVSRIPCKVYVVTASNIQFVNKLPTSILRSFSMNSHYWKCLPVYVIRKMMRESNVGQKLEVHELMMAAKVIEKSKSLDKEVLNGIFAMQLPQIYHKTNEGFIDRFNAAWNGKVSWKNLWSRKSFYDNLKYMYG